MLSVFRENYVGIRWNIDVENLLIEVFIPPVIFNTDRITDEIFYLH
jgi:hypothetical protein